MVFGSKGKFEYNSKTISRTTCIVAVTVLVVFILFLIFGRGRNESYANTSAATDTRNLPGFPDYQVMSQLPWTNPPVGRGEMNYPRQVAAEEEFPRHRWLVDVPISRPPDEVSLYQTGMHVDPAIVRIGTGKFYGETY
jgi:hypothetical protein